MKIVSCECTLWYHSCTTDNSVWPYRFVKHIEMQKAFPCWFRYILFPTRTVTGQNIFLTVISNTLKTWMKSKIYDEIFRVCCYTFGVCSQAEWHTSVHKYSFFFFFFPWSASSNLVTFYPCAARWGALSAKMLTVGTPAPLSIKYFGLEFILEASEQCMSPEESLLVLWHFWTCPPAAPEQYVHCTFCGTTSFSTGSKECLFVLYWLTCLIIVNCCIIINHPISVKAKLK